jgi:hypothetical protein
MYQSRPPHTARQHLDAQREVIVLADCPRTTVTSPDRIILNRVFVVSSIQDCIEDEQTPVRESIDSIQLFSRVVAG